MRSAAAKLLTLLTTCSVVGLCAAAVGAGTSASSFGVGLKLGKVVHTIEVGSSIGPWLVWNSKTCAYETAKSHPSAYKANIRKVVGGPTQIGYMNYGDTDPFGVANSKNIKEMAALAGFKLSVYNLKYPSQTEPLTQAHNSVLKKDRGVIQAQQLDTLSNAFLKIMQTQGCIPTVQMYLRVPNVPSFGAVWADTGTTQGTWLAQQAKAKKWNPNDTALVECTDPDVGASVNIMFDTAPKALVAGGFAIPSKNIYKIVCKYSQTQSAQVNVKGWFTGHPNFKHIMINTIDDERMQGAINALNQVGRFKDALTVASGADGLGQKQIKAGLEGASVAYFPERYGEWLLPILEDVMAGNPVPSFTGSKLVVITKANIGKYYPR
jgi:ribose transport system substrate-binding protein